MDGYSPEEWGTVVNAPMAAGLGVISADLSLTSMYSEFKEIVRTLAAGGDDFPQSKVIQEIITFYSDKNEPPADLDEGTSTEKLISQVAEASNLVRGKSGEQEAQYYADFIRKVAKRTAESSGEGFLGTGEKVSGKEQSYLENLEKALAG